MIRYDFNGNKTIIFQFTKGDIFGEVLYPTNTNNELFVEAKENCEILSFIYDNIMYAELNTKSDYCQKCGFDGEIL